MKSVETISVLLLVLVRLGHCLHTGTPCLHDLWRCQDYFYQRMKERTRTQSLIAETFERRRTGSVVGPAHTSDLLQPKNQKLNLQTRAEGEVSGLFPTSWGRCLQASIV